MPVGKTVVVRLLTITELEGLKRVVVNKTRKVEVVKASTICMDVVKVVLTAVVVVVVRETLVVTA